MTDPESGVFHKGEHKKCLAYTAQTACDKNGYIFDDDRIPVLPYKRPMGKAGFFRPYEYVFDKFYDCVICPENRILSYATTNRDGYREFKSKRYLCTSCPSIGRCTESSKNENDMWFERGISKGGASAFLGISGDVIKGEEDFDLNSLVGKTVKDDGFMSCGSTKNSGMSSSVNLSIYCPKGTEALYAEPFSNFGAGEGRNWNGKNRQKKFGGEFETILQRGTKCRITKAYRDENSGKLNVEMEVVSQKYKK